MKNYFDQAIMALMVLGLLLILVFTLTSIIIESIQNPTLDYQVTCVEPNYEVKVEDFKVFSGKYALETEAGEVLVPVDRCIIEEIK